MEINRIFNYFSPYPRTSVLISYAATMNYFNRGRRTIQRPQSITKKNAREYKSILWQFTSFHADRNSQFSKIIETADVWPASC